MLIRKLTSADFDAVNHILMQLHHYHVANRADVYRKIENSTILKACDYEASLKDKNKIMLGAEVDGKIVGIAVVFIRRPGNELLVPRVFAHIDDIAVDENYRRRGIGKALYHECVKCAKERGATSLELKVWGFNSAAVGFYQSLGMRIQNYTMEQKL